MVRDLFQPGESPVAAMDRYMPEGKSGIEVVGLQIDSFAGEPKIPHAPRPRMPVVNVDHEATDYFQQFHRQSRESQF